MSSHSKARPSGSADFSDAVRQAREARDGKEASTRAAPPAPTAGSASAVATDEARANEALEGLKRIRAKARLDKMAISKPAAVDVRPAVIVAKPPAPRPSWVAPLVGLALAVALVISACTGVIAYMTMQPSKTSGMTSADIRNLRDTVAQLRRQVSGVSESLDGLRTSVDLSSKATTDRFGRFADNLDRIERASSSSTAKLDRLAQATVSAPAMSPPQPPAQSMPTIASAGSGVDTTGSVLPSERGSAPKKVVKGWSVRQAYEGIAILQGPNGLVEAILASARPRSYRGDQEREWTVACVVQLRSNPARPESVALTSTRYAPLYEAKMIHHIDHRWDDKTKRLVPILLQHRSLILLSTSPRHWRGPPLDAIPMNPCPREP